MDILYKLSRRFCGMAAVENSNSLTLWRIQQMSMLMSTAIKMLEAGKKAWNGGHVREATKRYKTVR